MKIIFDNIVYNKASNGGVSNYWFELTKYLLEQQKDELLFFDYNNQRNFHRNNLELPTESIITTSEKLSFLERIYPISFKSDEKFIFHSSYYRSISGTKNEIGITTVHDFTHSYYSPFVKKVLHNKIKYGSIKSSKGIICISNNTYKDLLKFCPPKKDQKVAIIHNGVSDEYFPIVENRTSEKEFLQRFQLEEQKYLLYVGSRANYKNFPLATALLNKTTDMKLVVVGGNFTKAELQTLDQNLLKRIVVMTDIDNATLNVLYNFANAFIYPSSYEGFGIPIIEAMKAGCPVLSLNNSSITEVSGGVALLYDQINADDFKKGLDRLNDKSYRQDIIERGYIQAGKFSWQKCCEETRSFYQENYDTN
ncbi:glycosyltransferase family 4 protein [Flavobacterium cerinum]|uniref:Glycosyltransferase family 4 protein n=1 Tax=Flavobacterium cerinum TaxID=2502784 RepID=A0ABY5IVF7_9FLAO|nr:glycosyltransferase family 1 protein [Flavobacterium cerinum]UUC46280.1 glycosyltransferase family 4 protein [Flavobacterium cerinum]